MAGKKDDLIATARSRMAEAYSADLSNREAAEEDLRFHVGEQWPAAAKAEREAAMKPVVTLNQLPQFTRQVTGQIRSLNPSVKALPDDEQADPEVAEIISGLIRHIEAQCDASAIYEAAGESAAQCGIGNFRVRADYCDGDTFDQELRIERIPDPFAVYWDPFAKHPTRCDARYCFILEEMPAEEFERQYPGKASTSVDVEDRGSVQGFTWFTPDHVTVAEYLWIEHKSHKIGLLRDGSVVRDPVAPLDVVKTRTVQTPYVRWAKVTGEDVLEGPEDVPCRQIPVFAVTGEEIHIGKQSFRSSVTRFAKEAQVLYNLARSIGMEVMTSQPKAPYLVTLKQVAGLEKFWNNANSANLPYLPYNPDEKAGAPSRVPPPISSQGVQAEIALAAEDMKRTTGVYDASLGARSNETSGVAIERRQQESQNATSVYADNVVKAVLQCGKVMIDMIPRVYDTQRVIRILKETDEEATVLINAIFTGPDGPVQVNDFSIGKYDVRVVVGPAYATKRQEAAKGMREFIQAVPAAAAVTADLIAEAQEWPDAQVFAKRLKKMLPPDARDIEELDEDEQAAFMQQQQAARQAADNQAAVAEQVILAEARIKEAQAASAEVSAQLAQIELAERTGQINAAIQTEVARILQAAGISPPQMG